MCASRDKMGKEVRFAMQFPNLELTPYAFSNQQMTPLAAELIQVGGREIQELARLGEVSLVSPD